MKLLLESSAFEVLNNSLNFDTGDGNVIGRLESYSCKMVAEEKAQYKRFNSDIVPGVNDMEVLSPSQTLSEFADDYSSVNRQIRNACSVSEMGTATTPTTRTSSSCPSSASLSSSVESKSPFGHKVSRKTLFYLISTLNASFYPDYDFSTAAPQEFSMEPSLEWVVRSIERQLTASAKSDIASSLAKLWASIDDVIYLQDCEIYSYNPDPPSDPYFDEGCLWSFNYFFYNVRLKRIVFFTCRAASSLSDPESNQAMLYFDE